MRTSSPKITMIAIIAIFLAFNANAQFEQKFTLQLSGGYVQALSPEFFTNVFNNGFSVDAGAQYNFNRSFSLVVLAKYAKFLANMEFISGAVNIEYNQIGIGFCPKYRFLADKKVNPYLYGGMSVNYISFNLIGVEGASNTTPASLGFTGGVGFDFRVTDNLALFVQGGYNTFSSKDNWISSVYSQVGVNISMFKSKSL